MKCRTEEKYVYSGDERELADLAFFLIKEGFWLHGERRDGEYSITCGCAPRMCREEIRFKTVNIGPETMKDQQLIWVASVETTNSSRDTFKADVGAEQKYFKCESGLVYLVAPTIEDAARQLPDAVKIERVGKAFEVHRHTD